MAKVKPPIPPAAPLAQLEWLDAHSPEATKTYNLEEAGDVHQAIKITTVGYVLRNDDGGITIAGEWCGDNDYRGLTFVPKGMVIQLKPLGKTNRQIKVVKAGK